MSEAYTCDYCHELMRTDFGNRDRVRCIPAVKDKHSGGDITFHVRVDGVPSDACQPCMVKHLQSLIKTLEKEQL